jgi:DNA-binding response OmpR family regulator
MALVLCAGAHAVLTQTRQLILEAAGHTVVPAYDENQIKEACAQNEFQVVVIGQSSKARLKREWGEIVRKLCPKAKVLEVFTPNAGPVIKDADDRLESPALPEELAERVSALTGEKRVVVWQAERGARVRPH